MPLERYALGTPQSENSFCYWLEYKSDPVGSIRGGSAQKHLIFKRKSDGLWDYPQGFADEKAAWDAIRGSYLKAFDLAHNGNWSDIDSAATLAGGPAVRLKSLFIYFPIELVPVYAAAHLTHFIRILGSDPGPRGPVGLNRHLLQLIKTRREFNGWSSYEAMIFLYDLYDPRGTQQRVVKIAPGELARKWPECRDGGYISVGWNDVGDLRQFANKEDFQKRYLELYAPNSKGAGNATQKANELWMLRELEPGDVIVANRGTSSIVGVGTVVSPGYKWRPELNEYNHTVTVNWTDTNERSIDPVPAWGLRTIASIGAELWQKIRAAAGNITTGPESEPIFGEIRAALQARGQVILYGPPGTGKTRAAVRFGRWLESHPLGDSASGISSPSPAIETVTFHPSYSYEDFIEGYRPVSTQDSGLRLELRDGIFRSICERAAKEPTRPYLLIVDEINRGNIPKIFGELITLLELDKRDQLVRLPSGRQLKVPSNLYIIGTMNTADRSIRLLDAALRRRFAFIELMPDESILEGVTVGQLPLGPFLHALNQRILEEASRERLVGHSYFLRGSSPLTDPTEFARMFRQELVPLLEEFCFDDFDKLARILGSDIVEVDAQRLNESVLEDTDRLLASLAKHLIPPAATPATT